MRVELSTGEKGVLEAPFGQTGKVRVRVPSSLRPETLARLGGISKGRKKNKAAEVDAEEDASPEGSAPVTVVLSFNRYLFDPARKMHQ